MNSYENTTDERLRQCHICGNWQDERHFGQVRNGRRRHVCNHCRYVHTIRPSRQRRLLRELEERKGVLDF